MAEQQKPNPGSPEAREAGCTCPVLDNAHGNGYMGVEGVFVYTAGCSIHWPVGTTRAPFVATEGGNG